MKRKAIRWVNLNKVLLVNYLIAVAKRCFSNEIFFIRFLSKYKIWLSRFIRCSREFNQIYILKVVFVISQCKLN